MEIIDGKLNVVCFQGFTDYYFNNLWKEKGAKKTNWMLKE